MSTDFVSEVDKKFFADNLLVQDDWEADIGGLENDLCNFLDVESNLGSGNLISQFADNLHQPCDLTDHLPQIPDDFSPLMDDLQLPMLEDHGFHASEFADQLPIDLTCRHRSMDIASDSSDSGVESVAQIKDEPLSPAMSHHSESSNDSGMGQTNLENATWASIDMIDHTDEVKEENPSTPPSCSLLSSPNSPATMPFILSAANPLPSSPTAGTICKTSLVNGNTVTVLANGVPSSPPVGSQVAIQPKPMAPLKPKCTLTPQSPGKPLVLTAEEFAQLTAQGVLKFHPPTPPEQAKTSANVSVIGSQAAPTVVTQSNPTVLSVPSLPHGDFDVRAVKRQQRMIKNRESACLSRKRKKEYLSTLEQRLQDCAKENEKLKQENVHLKRKISQLENENGSLKYSSPVKKVCLLAVVFFMCLNLSPFSLIPENSNPLQAGYIPEGHISRSLKSVDDTPDIELPRPTYNANLVEGQSSDALQQILKQNYASGKPASLVPELFWRKGMEGLGFHASMCPSYFNSTESQRLMKELTGWVMGHQYEWGQRQEQTHKTEQRRRKKSKKLYRAPPRLKAAMKGGLKNLQYNVQEDEQKSAYEVQVFTGADQSYHDFLDTIHRRNDTFYVVSFRRDHLLLPATAHNKTTRPRMSLVMPAVSLNESMQPPTGRIAMMQIDCEVMATKLVHVDKSAVPPSAREYNHTSAEPAPGPAPRPAQDGQQPHYKRDPYDG